MPRAMPALIVANVWKEFPFRKRQLIEVLRERSHWIFKPLLAAAIMKAENALLCPPDRKFIDCFVRLVVNDILEAEFLSYSICHMGQNRSPNRHRNWSGGLSDRATYGEIPVEAAQRDAHDDKDVLGFAWDFSSNITA